MAGSALARPLAHLVGAALAALSRRTSPPPWHAHGVAQAGPTGRPVRVPHGTGPVWARVAWRPPP